jgi:arsenate reductase (glutaredoxin)
MSIHFYGIPNCDTVKKARAWLDAHQLPYVFHDYKKVGVDAQRLSSWCQVLGWNQVLNQAGTTFRSLPDDDKLNLDEAKAIALMVAQPSMIKRPMVEHAGGLLVGFSPAAFEALMTNKH